MNKTPLAVLAAAALALSFGTAAVRADQSSTTPAAPPAAAPAHHGHRGHFIKELGLSQDQITQIKSIRHNFRTQAQAIKNNAQLSDADRKAQLKALHRNTRKQIMAILTPDQKAKLRQLREQRHQAREGGETGAPQAGSTDNDQ